MCSFCVLNVFLCPGAGVGAFFGTIDGCLGRFHFMRNLVFVGGGGGAGGWTGSGDLRCPIGAVDWALCGLDLVRLDSKLPN